MKQYKAIQLFLWVLGMTCMYSLNMAYGVEINVAIGLSLPPYVIAETNSGIEFDIVKESLDQKGYTMIPRYVLLRQVPEMFKKKVVDAAMTVNEGFGLDGFLSDVVITYQNFAITLADNKISINTIEDLKDKSIIAFQNATIYLGELFAKTVQPNKNYSETPKQLIQVNLLYSNRSQVVISDKNIFLYYRNFADKALIQKDITFHPIFKPNPYSVAFRDEKIKNAFNQGLEALKKSGRYQEIINSYIQQDK
ncbi:MAG: ABC transporter substrate-binding protein [Desulfobacterales bacterium]|nr:ABC transporter substrate-binding protein [Desulfobacterales bacterium]